MNEHTLSQKINITQQPASTGSVPPITVPLTITLPATGVGAQEQMKFSNEKIIRAFSIIAGIFFLIGAGFFLLSSLAE
ncbi:hypothetical protein ABE288_07750 [Bacillus salipaludis]|uniref:hypothetical protein n=1 Tax=Bacillus salipaludis TaxID=2547811 RepID=UPI003D21C60A